MSDFQEARFKKFAKEFVDIYINVGETAAAQFVLKSLPKEEDRYTSQVYIIKEFESRGYHFNTAISEEV